MAKLSDEFMNKQVTISRVELGIIMAEAINEICDGYKPADDLEQKTLNAVEELLKRYSAIILSEVYSDNHETLEVEE